MCFGDLVTNDKLIQLVNPLLNEWLSMVKLKILSICYENAHSVCIRLASPGYPFKRIIKNTKFVSSFVVFLLLRKSANFLTTYFRCVSFWYLYKIWIFQARTQDWCKRNIFWPCFLSFACNFTYIFFSNLICAQFHIHIWYWYICYKYILSLFFALFPICLYFMVQTVQPYYNFGLTLIHWGRYLIDLEFYVSFVW